MAYLTFVTRRLLQAVPLVLAVVVFNFLLIHAAPGDPVDVLVGNLDADPAFVERVRQEFGLDRPLHSQLLAYLARLARFDLGFSLRFQQDVGALILSRLPATLLLMGTALALSSFGGVLLGVAAARRPFGLTDSGATLVAVAGYSMPVFWLGQLLLLLFAATLGWFPIQGMTSLRAQPSGAGHLLDIAHHLALPALTYSVYHLTLVYRMTRVKVQDALGQPFVAAARARGLAERRVVYSHALPTALLPVVTLIGLQFGQMLAGSVLTETVFAWPGLGRLMFEGIQARDYPVLLGLFACLSMMVIVANVLTDLTYALIDPRVVHRA